MAGPGCSDSRFTPSLFSNCLVECGYPRAGYFLRLSGLLFRQRHPPRFYPELYPDWHTAFCTGPERGSILSRSAAREDEDRLAAGYIKRMCSRDVDALSLLYGLYQAPLLSLIHAIVGEKEAAEEIFQDTFVQAFDQADRFNPLKGTPFVWLATIARRKSIDWIRKRDRRPQFVDVEREQESRIADKEKSNENFGISQQLEARFVLERFSDLPDREQRALELAFIYGYTQQEIANQLDCPLGTVKSDLRRGLQRLRQLYLGEDD